MSTPGSTGPEGPRQTPSAGGAPGTAPPHGAAPYRSAPASGFFDSMRRTGIWRTDERWIGGVAGGLARRLSIDPLLVRGVLVVMTFFGGLGLLLYGLGWALLPEESDGRIHLQEALRGNIDAALAGAAVFVLIGLVRPGFWWFDEFWAAGWFFLLIAALVGFLVALVARGRDGGGPSTSPPPAAGQPHGATAPASEAQPSGPGPTAPAAGGVTTGTDGAGPDQASAPTTAYGQAAYGTPPATSGPAGPPPTTPTSTGSTATPPPSPPPRPPRPRVPGPGRVTSAIVVGLSLLVLALMLLWDSVGWSLGPVGHPWALALVGCGAIVLIFGLGVTVTALRGRRGRGLTALGVLFALVMAPVTAGATVSEDWNVSWQGPGSFGERTHVPVSVSDAEAGYSLVAGDMDVRLTALDLDRAEPVVVPISMAAGDLRLVVPSDAAVEFTVQMGGGRLFAETGGGWTGPFVRDDGSGTTYHELDRVFRMEGMFDGTYRSPQAQENDPDLIIRATVGGGNIRLEETP